MLAKNLPLFALLVFLLAGCAHYDDRPLDPESNLAAFDARSLADPGLAEFMATNRPDAGASAGWNAAELTLAAFYFQPELAAARARWAAAVSEIGGAGEYPNPTFGIAPAFNSSTSSDEGLARWVIPASLDFTLEQPGKRKARIAQARFRADAAWLELVQTAWQTRVQVRAEMLDLYRARQNRDLLDAQEGFQNLLLQAIDRKRQLGGTGRMAVDQAREADSMVQLDWEEAIKQEGMARARLASVIGIPSSALRAVTLDFSEFEEQLPGEMPVSTVRKQALMNRADILGLLAEYNAAQSQLQLEVARQYPDLVIGPGYEYDQGDNKWGLGLSFTLPLFNRNQAAIETARRRREEAAARFNALQTSVLGNLGQASADYSHTYVQFLIASKMHAARKAMFQRLEKQAMEGAVSAEQELAGQIALLEMNKVKLAAQMEAQAALGRLESELQSPADLPGWQTALKQTIDHNEDAHENN